MSVCFFGDGASNQGVLMETLNVSALWRLPLVFVCENNGFSEFTPGGRGDVRPDRGPGAGVRACRPPRSTATT